MIKQEDEKPNLPGLGWHQRLNVTTVSLSVFVIAIVASLPALRGSGRELDHAGNMIRFLKRFFPPDFSVTGQVLTALTETVQIAVMATFFPWSWHSRWLRPERRLCPPLGWW